jgi:hypothetical protein
LHAVESHLIQAAHHLKAEVCRYRVTSSTGAQKLEDIATMPGGIRGALDEATHRPSRNFIGMPAGVCLQR